MKAGPSCRGVALSTVLTTSYPTTKATAPQLTTAPVADGPTRRPRPRAVVIGVVIVTLLAAALRLYRLSYGYAHAVTGYDGGVYLGSALHLVHGQLPYRDFVLVHPPGIMLLLTPDAFLAKVIGSAQAMGIAKILTGLVGAASVPLVARLVWHRGTVAVLLASVALAVQPDAVPSAYELLLEPWLVVFALLGLVLIFDRGVVRDGRALMWGGAALGFACATKVWAFVPALLLIVVLLPHRRRVSRYLGGLVLGFGVPVLPFLVAAPGAFWHDVFVAQALRGAAHRTTATFRIVHLFSVGSPNANLPGSGLGPLIAAGLLVGSVLAVLSVRLVFSRVPLERFAGLAAIGVVAMMFAPVTFYWHYTTFAVPFIALVAALGRPVGRRLPHRVVTGVLVAAVVGLAIGLVHRDAHHYSLSDEATRFDAVVPAGSCVVASMSSLTVADDRFAADATRPDCPTLLDSTGVALVQGDGSTHVLHSPALQRIWLGAYRHADFVYLTPRGSPSFPTSGPAQRYLLAHFHRLAVDGLGGALYARDSGR